MRKTFLTTIFLMLFLTTNCKADTFDLYKDTIHELNRDPKARTFKGNENNLDDFEDCQVDYKLGVWRKSEATHKLLQERLKNTWERSGSSIKGSLTFSGNIYLDSVNEMNSEQVSKDKIYHPVYIGPWHYAPRIQKQIRFFAYQKTEGGEINYQYESMTDENKTIKEKPFSLSPQAKIAPDKFSLCAVKWTAKFGYNAIAEVKSKNPFSKNYLVPTGKVIEVEE